MLLYIPSLCGNKPKPEKKWGDSGRYLLGKVFQNEGNANIGTGGVFLVFFSPLSA